MATIIDLAVLAFASTILFTVAAVINSASPFLGFIMYAIVSIMTTMNVFIQESILKGRTIGKMAMGIQVIKLTGKEATVGDYLARSFFRLIDIWMSFGVLGSMLIASTSYAQRLGGMMTDTIVVRLKPQVNVELRQLMELQEQSTDGVKYFGVTRYSEEDMLTAKSIADRYQENPNDAHAQLLVELTDRLVKELNVTEQPYDRVAFIRKVIKDYVVLTR